MIVTVPRKKIFQEKGGQPKLKKNSFIFKKVIFTIFELFESALIVTS